jgi:predicted transporter
MTVIGGRKFFIMILVMGVSTALAFAGKVSGAEFMNITITTVLAGFGANAGEHVAKAWKEIRTNGSK